MLSGMQSTHASTVHVTGLKGDLLALPGWHPPPMRPVARGPVAAARAARRLWRRLGRLRARVVVERAPLCKHEQREGEDHQENTDGTLGREEGRHPDLLCAGRGWTSGGAACAATTSADCRRRRHRSCPSRTGWPGPGCAAGSLNPQRVQHQNDAKRVQPYSPARPGRAPDLLRSCLPCCCWCCWLRWLVAVIGRVCWLEMQEISATKDGEHEGGGETDAEQFTVEIYEHS